MKKLVLSLFMLCTLFVSAFAQERTVTGTVVASEDGLPIPGASVKVKEASAVGATTGVDGKFSLKVPANGKTLVVSYLGYTPFEVAIPANGVVGSVRLTADAVTLNAVVVSAGGLQVKKREQGYASTSISSAQLTQAKATTVVGGLNGKVAGLQINVVSSGVNPSVRLVLRGNRSLLGNNEALTVLDNVIVPNSILSNLNPEDIEDIQVLNGAGAAALYGSDASNGALIITTKKGKRGVTTIKVSNTTSLEQVSFYPEMQFQFGSGYNGDTKQYVPYENQQYGPAFDGTMRQVGNPIFDGRIQTLPYSANRSKEEFWDTGVQNQTDFSASSGDEKGSIYLSGQYLDVAGTTPMDQYNRFSIRVNGERDLGKGVSIGFTTNYLQNRFDVTTATSSMYDQILQTPAQIPLTSYQDWRNDPFANPNGYYNEYYANPYFTLENNRQDNRNDYLQGSANIKWQIIPELSLLFRTGITTRNNSQKSYTGKFQLSAYTKSIGTSGQKTNDIAGSVNDSFYYETRLTNEVQANFIKKFGDFNVNFVAGGSIRSDQSKSSGVSTSGLVVAGVYNVSNRLALQADGSESNSLQRQVGLYGDLKIGYKDFLYLHVTGRNDWFSTLPVATRSVFYPAADISFVPAEVIDALKNTKVISNLKLRAGYSVVGNVNLAAYALSPTFGQAAGYPYNSGPGFSLSSQIVNPALKPELTKGYEFGFDADWYDNRITTSVTYFNTKTSDQIVPISISRTSGFTSYRTNTGKVSNEGIESSINVNAINSKDWKLSVGANYTYNNNKVLAINDQLPQIGLSTGGTAQVFAKEGMLYPVLLGSKYLRDDQGRVIVDPVTGFPSKDPAAQLLGNTNPKHILGTNLAVTWKQLRLSAVAEYRGGYVIFNSAGSGYDFSGSSIRTVTFNRERFVFPNSSYLDPVSGQYVANTNLTVRNGNSDFFAAAATNMDIAENYVNNGAYWKVREISLQYNLPQSVLSNLKFVKGATISVQGRNLFLFTPDSNIYTDPDYLLGGNAIGINTLSQTPPTRYYGATLSLTF